MVKRPLWDAMPLALELGCLVCNLLHPGFFFIFFPPLQLPQLWKSSEVMESWGCASSQSWPDGSQNLSWVLTLFLAFHAKMEGLCRRKTLALNNLFCLVNGATTPSGTLHSSLALCSLPDQQSPGEGCDSLSVASPGLAFSFLLLGELLGLLLLRDFPAGEKYLQGCSS